MRRLLTRKKPIRILTESKQVSSVSESSDNISESSDNISENGDNISENGDDSEGSLNDCSESSETECVKVQPKVVRKRRVRHK